MSRCDSLDGLLKAYGRHILRGNNPGLGYPVICPTFRSIFATSLPSTAEDDEVERLAKMINENRENYLDEFKALDWRYMYPGAADHMIAKRLGWPRKVFRDNLKIAREWVGRNI